MLQLYTSLSPDECYKRLNSALAQAKNEIKCLEFKRIPPLGYGYPDIRYTMRLKQITPYWNNYPPIFYGAIIQDNSSTLVTGTFRLRSSTRFFLIVPSLPFVIFFGILYVELFYMIIRGEVLSRELVEGTALFSLFPLLFIYAVWHSRFTLGRNEQEYIERFLRKTLDASVETTILADTPLK